MLARAARAASKSMALPARCARVSAAAFSTAGAGVRIEKDTMGDMEVCELVAMLT